MIAKDKRQKTKSKKRHGSKFEHSAGGVIYRKSGNGTEILLLCDRNKNWSFPKGLIEEDENMVKTAEREIEEEVGLTNLHFIDTVDSIGYFYRFEGKLIRKRVDFYLFEYKGNEIPKPLIAEGISDVQWFSVNEALKAIGYAKTNKPILEKAMKLATSA